MNILPNLCINSYIYTYIYIIIMYIYKYIYTTSRLFHGTKKRNFKANLRVHFPLPPTSPLQGHSREGQSFPRPATERSHGASKR